MSAAIAVFVKTPGYSAVKTRLAAATGAAFACEWYRRAADAVAAVAASLGTAVYWAIAEPAAAADGAWPGHPSLLQGEGGLGARMARVHAALVERHGSGILVGADTPQLDAPSVRAALAWLEAETPRQVLGPASDGGFWLYGGNRPTSEARWETVAYSRADTARRLRAAFADRGAWLELPSRTDVDRADDLAAMRDELAALSEPVAAQRGLLRWLDVQSAGQVG